MYFITPCDPNIFLIGIRETQIYGIGEKNKKLCIYTKSLFDVGRWKEFFVTDIAVVKCECCKNGLHVAASLDRFGGRYIWIAAREKESIHIFSINMYTKEFFQYKMLNATSPEFLNLNLCCKCLSPAILGSEPIFNFWTLIITPQKYQSNVGIFRIYVTLSKSGCCFLWKKKDSFLLDSRTCSNILIYPNGDVFSVIQRTKAEEEENGRIKTFCIRGENDVSSYIEMLLGNDDNVTTFPGMTFSIAEGYCLTRHKDGNKYILQIHRIKYCLIDISIGGDGATVDANFPSLESSLFYVSYSVVDKKYKNYRQILTFSSEQLHVIASFAVFQAADGNIVVIPLRPLSLSESACLALTRIPQPSRLRYKPRPVANISIYDYIFQKIRSYFGGRNESEEEDDTWMSLDFIKTTIQWPSILPLIKAPNFS